MTHCTSCTQETLSTAAIKNQISAANYDAAGNATSIPSLGSYSYDAENRLLTAGGVTYTYDGDGRRIKKSSGKLYWYGERIEVLDHLAFILSFQSRVSLENSGSH
jgi:hypothetical protein